MGLLISRQNYAYLIIRCVYIRLKQKLLVGSDLSILHYFSVCILAIPGAMLSWQPVTYRRKWNKHCVKLS